jgi:hypothetical protein
MTDDTEILKDFKEVVDIIVHWGRLRPTEEQTTLLANWADELLAITERDNATPEDVSRYQAFMFLMYSFNLPPRGLGTAYEIILNIFGQVHGVPGAKNIIQL